MSWAWIVSGGVVLALLGSSAWISLLGQILYHYRSLVRLKDLPATLADDVWPTLAVIFAARNEEEHVEQAARSMLALNYPSLEVIAVDDRSTDATGLILDRLGAEDRKLRVVHVQALPEGWLGKNHALHASALSTDAQWLLFTDADVRFAPESLRKAVAWAIESRLDHLTMTPEVITESFGERIFLAFFCLAFAVAAPPWRVTNRKSRAAMGVGAFNLVRAEAFRSVGGFQRLAMSVDDDMRLGQALKFAGYRPGVVSGEEEVAVRWQVGLGGMIRGLEKNFFSAGDFRLWPVPLGISMIVILGVMPQMGILFGPWWSRSICAAAVFSQAIMLEGFRKQIGTRWYHAIALPVGALAFATALARSAYVTTRNQGINWRDHHYPIAALRDHVRRRNAWANEVWRSTR